MKSSKHLFTKMKMWHRNNVAVADIMHAGQACLYKIICKYFYILVMEQLNIAGFCESNYC